MDRAAKAEICGFAACVGGSVIFMFRRHMGSMTRLYIRCENESFLATIRARYPEAHIEAPSLFASTVVEPAERFTPSDGERNSHELNTEIIYLAFSSVTDSLQFTHSMHGKTLRHIQYGMYVEQGLWEEVAGGSEPWETPAFFPPSSMEVLADCRPDDPDYERLSEIYGQRLIRASESYPMIDARESARAVAKHYRLTDWLDDWNGIDRDEATGPPPVSPQVLASIAPVVKPWWRFW
ncbi:hypothetical protein [Ramlibacter sp. WS9]|uniref:hypothetical protein n=1 Tax=Ramlibacter sp. WS9 TaxID=1882741 RepID=UPI00114337C4|nr:hypothetical protein [Ramlibacter sp. WS9]ROZ69630.1 hypothetical protein EEB15_22270 [Ramlibacter sp. WS9]